MATTTVSGVNAPEMPTQDHRTVLTSAAIGKVKEIMASQSPVPSGLRLSVVGGGCSASSIPWPSRTAPA